MTTLFNPSGSFLSSHNVHEYDFIRCIPIIPRLSLFSLRFHCTLYSNEKMEANKTLATLRCVFKLFSPDIVALLLSCLPLPNMFCLPQNCVWRLLSARIRRGLVSRRLFPGNSTSPIFLCGSVPVSQFFYFFGLLLVGLSHTTLPPSPPLSLKHHRHKHTVCRLHFPCRLHRPPCYDTST